MPYLAKYLQKTKEIDRNHAVIAYLAILDHLQKIDKNIADSIVQELKDQRSNLKLIASENYSSLAVQLAMGNLLTDKYSEGYPGHRFYSGCDNVDTIELEAIELAKKIFGADHAYVQPHSGADANMIAFWAILVKRIQNKEIEALGKKSVDELSRKEYEKIRKLLLNQKMMGMALTSGGHLTHGYLHNVSSKMMRAVNYEVDSKTHLIDYSKLAKQVKKEKPLILVAGYSAYAGLIDFAKMREIADSVQAVLLVDMAHFAGLVAGGVYKGIYNPVPFADILTSTTHKTLRGPRGGIILCKDEYREIIDRGCPLVEGGPLPHVMAAKAIAFKEASTLEFCNYARQVVNNAKALAEKLKELGCTLITNGTENHLVLIDVAKSFSLTGRQAENGLRQARITVNRNTIPLDQNGPWYTSGIRIGTPAVTTLGMKEEQMQVLAELIVDILKNSSTPSQESSKAKVMVKEEILQGSKDRVGHMLNNFPLYPEIEID